ncbi:MAG: hypothetical protein PHR06_06500 [Candidatus Cloacimonetes bacterium]|nr:hypothetical protein [Candidatus Cloacimonadota bacterium]
MRIAATISNNEILIQWSVVSGAIYYKVYSASSPDTVFPDNWTLEADNIVGLNWTDASIFSNKFYRVVAVDSESRIHVSADEK